MRFSSSNPQQSKHEQKRSKKMDRRVRLTLQAIQAGPYEHQGNKLKKLLANINGRDHTVRKEEQGILVNLAQKNDGRVVKKKAVALACPQQFVGTWKKDVGFYEPLDGTFLKKMAHHSTAEQKEETVLTNSGLYVIGPTIQIFDGYRYTDTYMIATRKKDFAKNTTTLSIRLSEDGAEMSPARLLLDRKNQKRFAEFQGKAAEMLGLAVQNIPQETNAREMSIGDYPDPAYC